MQSAEANLAIRKTREVNMMKEKLKVGVFGGGRGLTMMNVLLEHPDARLVAVCDKYQPSLDKVSHSTMTVLISLSLELSNMTVQHSWFQRIEP